MKKVPGVLLVGWETEVLSSNGLCRTVVTNILSYNVRGLEGVATIK